MLHSYTGNIFVRLFGIIVLSYLFSVINTNVIHVWTKMKKKANICDLRKSVNSIEQIKNTENRIAYITLNITILTSPSEIKSC